MTGKLLIVEDEPIVALDLKEEVEEFGCEVVGVAESADEALMAVEENLPDLALMDVRIVGSMDGIQTARLLREAYGVPVIFLTSYSDDTTTARAAREMPYGYLTKPFQSRELRATLEMALHKAKVDEGVRTSRLKMASTVDGMHEALMMVSLDGEIQFMNTAAELLTGRAREYSTGRQLVEVLDLRDNRSRLVPIMNDREQKVTMEEFGLSLRPAEGGSQLVDLTVCPLADDAGRYRGYVITLRKADERLRAQAIEGFEAEFDPFEAALLPMVQLDGNGHIVRVNRSLLRESGIGAESLVGRTLSGLSTDPDPRIAKRLMHKLLQGDARVTTFGLGAIF
jgi:PAS domain S-box-containing protein